MSDYIVRKEGDTWIAIDDDGEERAFDDHEEAIEHIANMCLEEDGEYRLLYDDGSGDLEEIPNFDPERFLQAGRGRSQRRPSSSSNGRKGRNVRKSGRERASSRRRRRSTSRGGAFDFGTYMNTAHRVSDNLSQLFTMRDDDEI